jgi:hypothetical protein
MEEAALGETSMYEARHSKTSGPLSLTLLSSYNTSVPSSSSFAALSASRRNGYRLYLS